MIKNQPVISKKIKYPVKPGLAGLADKKEISRANKGIKNSLQKKEKTSTKESKPGWNGRLSD